MASEDNDDDHNDDHDDTKYAKMAIFGSEWLLWGEIVDIDMF